MQSEKKREGTKTFNKPKAHHLENKENRKI
jgi:hypothetical protein